jgi:CO/xanthine dehydrogenase FAD-binding subunit
VIKEYFLPQSLAEAAQLLADHGPALLVMAGGTIAMPLINEGISTPEKVMGLRRAGLNYTRRHNGSLLIGATTTLTQVQGLAEIPMLVQAAHHTGGWAVCNMGTLGGNLFAPPPAGDVAVALLALEAQVKLVNRQRERLLPLAEFYTGFMAHALQPDELLAEIQVPLPPGQTAYTKYGRRQAVTPAVVTVAAHLTWAGDQVKTACLALNGVGPHPFRATQAEAALIGSALNATTIAAAAEAAMAESDPATDSLATAWYRRKMVGVYVKRTLSQLVGAEV